jgi:hypothetical protein
MTSILEHPIKRCDASKQLKKKSVLYGSSAVRKRFWALVHCHFKVCLDSPQSNWLMTRILKHPVKNGEAWKQSKGKQFRMRVSRQPDLDPRRWIMFCNCLSINWWLSSFPPPPPGNSAGDGCRVVIFQVGFASVTSFRYRLPLQYDSFGNSLRLSAADHRFAASPSNWTTTGIFISCSVLTL